MDCLRQQASCVLFYRIWIYREYNFNVIKIRGFCRTCYRNQLDAKTRCTNEKIYKKRDLFYSQYYGIFPDPSYSGVLLFIYYSRK